MQITGIRNILQVIRKLTSVYCSILSITKHLMTGPPGNSELCFPSTLDVPFGFASGNTEGLGETKLTVSLGASY